MAPEKVNELVEAAVGKSFQLWAAEHPSLASVIDHLRLCERTAESLRNSPAYQKAVEDYHRDCSDLNLLNRLIDLAGPVLLGILAA